MHVSTRSWLRFVGASVLAFLALPASAEDNMVLQWNAIASNSIVVVAAKSPAAAAPLFAIVQGAVYDATNAIDGRYAPFAVVAHAVPGASAEAAVATAAHDVLVGRLPSQKADLDAAYAASLAAIPDGDAKTDGIALGAEVASGWLALRADDGYEAPVPPYDVPPGPGNWERTPPGFADPIAMWLPYLMPFTLRSGDQFRPEAPPSLRSKAWAVDYNEVKLVGAKNSPVRTPAQTEAALFWVENTLGQYNRAWRELARKQGLSLADSARMLAMLDIAAGDAVIVCWDAKYTFNFWRPVTAIRAGDTDGNKDTIADPTWEPSIVTPAHPEYPSGHSTVSSAVAQVAAAFFGTDKMSWTIDSLSSRNPDGSPSVHHYARFSDVAREVIGARIWAGIHYRTACLQGAAGGKKVAHQLLKNSFQKVD